MNWLLAQVLPGYVTDEPTTGFAGPPLFSSFAALFNPANPGFSLGHLVSRLLIFAIVSAGLFFFVKLLLAGYTYLTSQGDSAKIQAAAKNLTNATVGLAVVIAAFFLAQIIQVVLGIDFL